MQMEALANLKGYRLKSQNPIKLENGMPAEGTLFFKRSLYVIKPTANGQVAFILNAVCTEEQFDNFDVDILPILLSFNPQ